MFDEDPQSYLLRVPPPTPLPPVCNAVKRQGTYIRPSAVIAFVVFSQYSHRYYTAEQLIFSDGLPAVCDVPSDNARAQFLRFADAALAHARNERTAVTTINDLRRRRPRYNKTYHI